MNNVKITCNDEKKMEVVTDYSIEVLKELAAAAGLESIRITSTLRTPEGQARAMYHNAKNTGYDKQIALYGPVGRSVLKVSMDKEAELKAANPNVTDEELKAAATSAMIEEIGRQFPKRVSRHVVPPEEYAKLNVIDIGYDSVADKEAFREALKAASEKGQIKYIDEPENDCFHIEIPAKE